jgi:hypothetical protein
LFAATTVYPRLSSRRLATTWLTWLSSTSRMRPLRRALPHGVARDQRQPMPLSRLDTQGQPDRAEQFRTLDGFAEVAGDAQLPAPCGIARLAGRGQHHDRCACEGRIVLDGRCQGEAIRVGHLDIGQDKIKGCP